MAERHVIHPRLGVVRALLWLQLGDVLGSTAEVVEQLADRLEHALPALPARVPGGGPPHADCDEVCNSNSILRLWDTGEELGVVTELVRGHKFLQSVPV